MSGFNLSLYRGTQAFSATAKFGADSLSGGVLTDGAQGATGVPAFIFTASFTVECQVYVPATPTANRIAVTRQGGTSSWLGVTNTGVPTIGLPSSVFVGGTTPVSFGAWHHLAAVFVWSSGTTGTLTLYVDGTSVASKSVTVATSSTSSFYVGGYGATTGFDLADDGILVDEVSVSTTAQYTANFTPPAAAFTNTRSGQVDLYHFDAAVYDSYSTPVIATLPTVSGTFTVGQTLTCSQGTWTIPITSYAYQWTKNGTAISGATSSTYVLQTGDTAASIGCTVTATAPSGSGTANSTTLAQAAPTNAAAPAVSGTIGVGGTLTTTNGTWNNAPTSFTYQWNRSGTAISGATSSTYTEVQADISASMTCTVTATNTYGTGTATSNALAAPGIVPTDPNIIYSPYNWDVQPARAKSVNAGAYMRCLIDGSVTNLVLTFDMSAVNSVPQIKWRVDDGPWTLASIASSVPLTIPATNSWTSHVVEFVVKASDQAVNRFTTDASAVKFTGITTSTGGISRAIQRKGLNVLVFGDSITEGVRTIFNSGTYSVGNDATQGWAYNLRENLGAEVGVVGFGGQGYTVLGGQDVPVFPTSYAEIFQDPISGNPIARSFTTPAAPDLIFINMGTNDSAATSATVQADAIAVLNGLLAATPAKTMIVQIEPFNASQAAALQAAVAGCSTPSRVFYGDTTGLYNSVDGSSTGLHPYGYVDTNVISERIAAIGRQALASAGPLMVNSGGSWKSVSPARL